MMMEIKETAKKIHKNAVNKGFWDNFEYYRQLEKLEKKYYPEETEWPKVIELWITTMTSLIGTEVSEAIEAMRKDNIQNFAEELADIVIRTFDLAEGLGIDIADEIKNKMEINSKREHKHGKKF